MRALLIVSAFCSLVHAQTPAGGVAAPPAPVPSIPIALPSGTAYLPKLVLNVGGGFIVPGSGKFGYWGVSTLLGQQSYATAVNEYTLQHGQVVNCALAGVSKILYAFGHVQFGITGLGGGCQSTAGNSAPAASGQGFGMGHFGKSKWSAIVTVEKTSGADIKVTAGVVREQ